MIYDQRDDDPVAAEWRDFARQASLRSHTRRAQHRRLLAARRERRRRVAVAILAPLGVLAFLFVLVVAWTAIAWGAPAMGCGSLHAAPRPHYRRVVWVWLENRGPAALSSPAAPYLERLGRDCASLPGAYGETHASWRNYMVAADGLRFDAAHRGARSIFELVAWRAYFGGMPAPCLHQDSWPYEVSHNAPAWFRRVTGCAQHEGNLAALDERLRSGGLYRGLTWIVPGVTGDCVAGLATCDAWLRRWLPRLYRTPSYQAGETIIILTWDEGRPAHYPGGNGVDCLATRAASCRIPTIIISRRTGPCVCPGPWSHVDALRLTLVSLGAPLIGGTPDARPLKREVGL